jgi:hypothetical protein
MSKRGLELMQQIRKSIQIQKRSKPNAFVSVKLTWCRKADVKITFPDDIESDTQAICELLDDSTNDSHTKPC